MEELPPANRPACRKSSSGRRLSWADQAPPLSARPIADDIPPLLEEHGEEAPDRPGEVTINLGILRQGNTYGVTGALPVGTFAATAPPMPIGMTVEFKLDVDAGVASLWVETIATTEGRLRNSFVVSLCGGTPTEVEHTELLVHVEANIMGPRDGRPSRMRDNVVLLNEVDREVLAGSSEAAEWKRASQVGVEDDDDDDDDP